jgi:hypothetical protein
VAQDSGDNVDAPPSFLPLAGAVVFRLRRAGITCACRHISFDAAGQALVGELQDERTRVLRQAYTAGGGRMDGLCYAGLEDMAGVPSLPIVWDERGGGAGAGERGKNAKGGQAPKIVPLPRAPRKGQHTQAVLLPGVSWQTPEDRSWAHPATPTAAGDAVSAPPAPSVPLVPSVPSVRSMSSVASSLRVVELSTLSHDDVTAATIGCLLSWAGANVTLIEPPDAEDASPHPRSVRGRQPALFAHLNGRGKRSVALDLPCFWDQGQFTAAAGSSIGRERDSGDSGDTNQGSLRGAARRRLLAILATSDVCVATEADLVRCGIAPDHCRSLFPNLLLLAVSPWGLNAAAKEAAHTAGLSGLARRPNGDGDHGGAGGGGGVLGALWVASGLGGTMHVVDADVEAPPAPPPQFLSCLTGIIGFAAVTTALCCRTMRRRCGVGDGVGGEGQVIDVSHLRTGIFLGSLTHCMLRYPPNRSLL